MVSLHSQFKSLLELIISSKEEESEARNVELKVNHIDRFNGPPGDSVLCSANLFPPLLGIGEYVYQVLNCGV